MQLTASEDLREQLSAKTVTRRWRGIVSEGMALRQGHAHSCSSHAMLAENLMQRMQTCVSVPLVTVACCCREPMRGRLAGPVALAEPTGDALKARHRRHCVWCLATP